MTDGAPVIRIAPRTFLSAAFASAILMFGGAAAAQERDEIDPGQEVSALSIDLAGWILASDDNRGMPFAVIDKELAQVLVFGADGKLKGLAPVLIGSAVGDTSAPGIADRELKDIPMKDRTTPAGRFIAGYGPATGGERVLWVDYDTAVSMHPISETNIGEQRKKRLDTPTPKDNRITHGCINVSPEFYEQVVSRTFKQGGVFYVLPEKLTLEAAFPALAAPGAPSAAEANRNANFHLIGR